MRPLNTLSDSELDYIKTDCAAAIAANPLGHKSESYLEDARACQGELNRRALIRGWRRAIASQFDPLTVQVRLRRRRTIHTAYALDAARGAAFNLGWARLHWRDRH